MLFDNRMKEKKEQMFAQRTFSFKHWNLIYFIKGKKSKAGGGQRLKVISILFFRMNFFFKRFLNFLEKKSQQAICDEKKIKLKLI